ncbi:hypothetical protein CYMTET_20684 [Cymbomonas tetramitiformis]|uniref:Uncharacterized protein n=1 Tax=Cymbomonas tetramitiformis TaxID=36881 RepID=A0AAE0G3P6_9CHLO|nr:hypothetical protein CYMTET_20684 [Cymbomonas tetramitiformis]
MTTGTHLDALQPGSVGLMARYNIVVMTSSPFRVLDLALPLLAAGRELVCAHAPLHYAACSTCTPPGGDGYGNWPPPGA